MIMANPAMLPPGFRFHPTDEELILHYLRNRAANAGCPVDIIADVDIYKFDPWDLPSRAAYGDKEWYFFSPRDRKYPNGIRPNRAAGSGYWKATGTDKPIHSSATGESVGVKKALVFYKGRPPKGTKTNWIMHEYRLAADAHAGQTYRPMKFRNTSMRLDDWVLCRIYKKTSHVSPMAVPPLSDHELDEPCGFDNDNPYYAAAPSSSAATAMLQQQATAALGTQMRMPRIPSITELFNDPSMAHYFEDGLVVPDMARLDHHQHQQHHDQHGGATTTLIGHPVMNHHQLLGVNNGSNSLQGGQITQMDSMEAGAGKRKRSETSTSGGTASAGKKPNGSCFGATFQIGNGLQAGSLGHHMLLHSNMGMN
ncbi:hypothetical protein HU200_017821 [Digitaria exilis]|uniref:NAC domain-containing protein n=1 Tax=Digitaria exilis TaxID=1010633 RepID=A0A835F4W0_9POAL|nr:hypothetical protein HU200_017821 [Digitaria exilis]